jgi:hypothetical protein
MHMALSWWTARSSRELMLILDVMTPYWLLDRNGDNVDSEKGRKLQKRFTEELFAKLEGIQPGVTAHL